jgi:hypothetical protein
MKVEDTFVLFLLGAFAFMLVITFARQLTDTWRYAVRHGLFEALCEPQQSRSRMERIRFAHDSLLEEGVSSEPVSEARPYRRSGGRAVNPGGGGHKKLGINPRHYPLIKCPSGRRVAGADQFRSAPNPSE